MQNKAGLIIIFIALSVVLLFMFSVDQWSSNNSKSGYITTGTGMSGEELYTGAVSEIKVRNSYADFSVSEAMDVPGAVVLGQTDEKKVDQKLGAKVGFANIKAQSQGVSENFGGTSYNLIAQQTNPADNFETILIARTTEVKANAADPSKSKSESKTDDSKKKNAKMKLPGEPSSGSSLPISDGTWLLLLMLSGYGMNKRIAIYKIKQSLLTI